MRIAGLLGLFLALSAPALAEGPKDGTVGRQRPGDAKGQKVTEQQTNAVRELWQRADLVEEAAELAEEKASTPELRALANQLDDEYERFTDQLEDWGEHRGLDFDDMPKPVSNELQELHGLSGKDFDDAFLAYVSREAADVSKEIDSVSQDVGGRDFKRDMDRAKTSLDRVNQEIDRQMRGEKSP